MNNDALTRQAFEEALDDLHRAAEIIQKLANLAEHVGENDAVWLSTVDGEAIADAKAFVQHVKQEWNR